MYSKPVETHAQLLTRAATRPATLTVDDRVALGLDTALVVESLQAHVDLIDERIASKREHRKPKSTITAARRLELLELARAGKLKVSRMPIAEIRAVDLDPKFSQLLDEAIWAGLDTTWPGEAPTVGE